MHPLRIAKAVDIDPLAAAAGLAGRFGTVLLHDQTRDAPSRLYFDPRWTYVFDEAGARWSGDVPAPAPPADAPLRWPWVVQRRWRVASRGPSGGLAGWLGFDLGPARWEARHPVAPPFVAPDAWLGAFDLVLAFGHGGPPELVATDLTPWVREGPSLSERWEAGLDLLRDATRSRSPSPPGRTVDVTSLDRAWHARAAARIQRHLRAGDIYQANLTGFATARTSVRPWDAFREQARVNPVPYAAYVHAGEAIVTSHSPERLLSLRGRHCVTSPIKGTTAAGPGDLRRLQASAKDRAEHVMIVDLCRHDLGRVCEYGSVCTRDLMTGLRLEGLVHLVSHVEGRLRRGARVALLESVFPGGSVTGAPKRRAQEILRVVEQSRRGPYTGSIGFVDATGEAQWSIAIRTAVWQNDRVAFGCGGGIVIDSDPAGEFDEAQLKAASFFKTLRLLSEPQALAARAKGL
jgi:para-aminobenzoate synthetase component 1